MTERPITYRDAGVDVDAGEDMLLPRTRNGAERRVQ